MSICTNCFNGCVQTTSDQCVKYTGTSIPALGITTGDTLSSVESAITTYLLTALDGTGIVPSIEPSYICTLVSGYLPANPTAVDLFTAIIRALCDLVLQVEDLEADMTALNANYVIGTCISGVTESSNTHEILQAVITKLCSINSDLTTIAANFANYVLIADINTYIAAYLAAIGAETKYYTKMVPYTAVEYYGDLSGKFDLTGAGYGDWENIYLCNGQNGTPDKRGRIPVGATTMGTTAFNAKVDPAIPGNPTYALNTIYGDNTITLSEAEMPIHSHSNTATASEHTHTVTANAESETGSGGITGGTVDSINDGTSTTSSADPSITITMVNATAGSGEAHSNIPPVYGCYYIMYIP